MKKGTANLIALVGSIIGIVGFFFNWIKLFGFDTFSGFGLTQILLSNYFGSTVAYGILLLLALLVLIVAAVFSFFVLRGRQISKGQAIILIALGAISLFILLILRTKLSVGTMGFGFILTVLGAIAVVVGGVLSLLEAPDTAPVTLQSLKQELSQSANTAGHEIGRAARNVADSFSQSQQQHGQPQQWQGGQQQNGQPQQWQGGQQQYGQPQQWQGGQQQASDDKASTSDETNPGFGAQNDSWQEQQSPTPPTAEEPDQT